MALTYVNQCGLFLKLCDLAKRSSKNAIPQTGQFAITDEEMTRERLPRVVNVDKYELTIWPHYPFDGIQNRREFLK